MDMRDILWMTVFAFSTVFLSNFLIEKWKGPKQDGTFIAATSRVESAPLKLEVDFLDKEQKINKNTVDVKTRYATMTFSNQGATISDLTFIRNLEHKVQKFEVWNSKNAIDREQQPFLIALDKETPYYYQLVKNNKKDNYTEVVYKADTSQGSIEKTFKVYNDINKIDLTIAVKPKEAMSLRVIWPSPFLEELGDSNFTMANVIDVNNKFKQISESKINQRQGFIHPKLFGTEDKYFVFSMVKDHNNFTDRAYYKTVGKHVLSFLETKGMTEDTSWTFSFYVGPKDVDVMVPVDPQLEKILNLGFFSFIAKPLLKVLKFLQKYTHNYGFAIVLLTFLLKLFLLPFTFNSEQKMRQVGENQKKLEYLNQKYKNDPKKLEEARFEHMRKHGTGGLIGGCLPLLLQMPLFFALSSGLNNSIELYKAPFIFWIQDLSLPDPYYVLSFIICISILVSSLSSPGKKDLKTLMTPLSMVLLFGAFSTTMASGLALYIAVNMVLQGVQMNLQKYLSYGK